MKNSHRFNTCIYFVKYGGRVIVKEGEATDVNGNHGEDSKAVDNTSKAECPPQSEGNHDEIAELNNKKRQETVSKIKDKIAELKEKKKATKQWLKRLDILARCAADPHHADLLNNTIYDIKTDVKKWDEAITAMLCILRKLNASKVKSIVSETETALSVRSALRLGSDPKTTYTKLTR